MLMFDFVSLPSVHLVIYCVSLHRNYVWIWFFVFVSVHFLKIFYLKWWKCVNSVDTVYTEKHQLLEIDIQKEWNWNYLLKRHLLIIFSQFICSFVAFLCFFFIFIALGAHLYSILNILCTHYAERAREKTETE